MSGTPTDPIADPNEPDPAAGGAETPGDSQTPQGDLPATDPGTTDSKTDPVQQRIDVLTKRRRDAERDAAYWRGVAESRAQTATSDPAPPTSGAEALNPDDFKSDADYLKAYAAAIKKDVKADVAENERVRRERERSQQLSTQYAEARKKYPDFDDLVAKNNTLQVTPTMFDAAQGASLADVLHHLGKNPDESARIASLPETHQIKEIGKIEGVVSTPTKQTTKAPPPPPRIDGGGGSPPEKPESELSRSELHAKWTKDRRTRAGLR